VAAEEFTKESLLAELVGRELSSIEFVRDYLQVRFDGPTLTLIVWPTLFKDGRSVAQGDVGFTDKLLSLIGKEVSDCRFRPEDELVLIFLSGELLRVALDRASRGILSEAVYFDFHDAEHRLFVA
jgi:hypothetical protein